MPVFSTCRLSEAHLVQLFIVRLDNISTHLQAQLSENGGDRDAKMGERNNNEKKTSCYFKLPSLMCDIVARLIEFHAHGVHITPYQKL